MDVVVFCHGSVGKILKYSQSDGYVPRLLAALRSIRNDEVEALLGELLEVRARGGRVFVIGNGGSAATASHMATDLGVGSQRVNAGLRVSSLCDNSSAITAAGNDLSFTEIFASQIRLLAEEGDLLIVISASGNSPNLVEAVSVAKQKRVKVACLTGFSGGQLRQMGDISVHVETAAGDYGPAEDAHMAISHMVTELLRHRVGSESDARNLHG